MRRRREEGGGKRVGTFGAEGRCDDGAGVSSLDGLLVLKRTR